MRSNCLAGTAFSRSSPNRTFPSGLTSEAECIGFLALALASWISISLRKLARGLSRRPPRIRRQAAPRLLDPANERASQRVPGAAVLRVCPFEELEVMRDLIGLRIAEWRLNLWPPHPR